MSRALDRWKRKPRGVDRQIIMRRNFDQVVHVPGGQAVVMMFAASGFFLGVRPAFLRFSAKDCGAKLNPIARPNDDDCTKYDDLDGAADHVP